MLRNPLRPILTRTEERSLENDLMFGGQNELSAISLLNTYFNTTFRNTKDIYNTPYYQYDFENEDKTICIEMKSRRNRHNTYPTTIVPVSKVNNTINRYVFVFHFTDGIYFIDYNKDLFDTYETRMINTYRKGIVDVPKLHFCIPITDLTKIN